MATQLLKSAQKKPAKDGKKKFKVLYLVIEGGGPNDLKI